MPLNPPEPVVPAPSTVARAVVVGIAVVALLFAIAMVARSGNSKARNRVETAAGDDQATPKQPPNQRPGRPTVPQVTVPTEPTPSAPAKPTPPPTNRSPNTNPPLATAPISNTARPADAAAPSRPTAATPDPAGPSGSTEPTVFIELTEEPPIPIGPTDEQKRCANLGLVAIGDPAPGDDAAEAAKARFRSAMAQIPPTDELVCGKPVARYLDDLLIQRVQVAGMPTGILVGGTTASHPVLWLSEVEWTSYKRMEPAETTHNFTGVPVERMTIGGHQMIRTSRGAVVMVRADSWGHTVMSGAWDVWMASGGPTGPMGLPEGIAIKDPEGAHQDFTNGVLKLPGVTSKLEAEAMPASRYVWSPITAEQLLTPPPAPHSIADIDGVSYYVDRSGVRHWLDSTSAWSCARYDLGAAHIVMRGWQAARAPLGAVFTCPPKPPA
ncbi:MAG: hypothetical protein ABI239_02895 [Aquihabitans sp.]